MSLEPRTVLESAEASSPRFDAFSASIVPDDQECIKLLPSFNFMHAGNLEIVKPAYWASGGGTARLRCIQSDDLAISSKKAILHKIGVTSQDVRRRVADARNDPTFLLAPVEIVATYALQNLSRHKVEELLHRFFAAARPAQLFIVDRFGKRVYPKEWLYVLPEHVSRAAQLIQEGQLHLYWYDPRTQTILLKAGLTG